MSDMNIRDTTEESLIFFQHGSGVIKAYWMANFLVLQSHVPERAISLFHVATFLT